MSRIRIADVAGSTAAIAFSIAAIALLLGCNGHPGPAGREPVAAAPAPGESAVDTVAIRAASEEALLSDAERLQSNVDAILAASSQVAGTWFVGDVTAEFTMYFDGDRETYAEERVDRAGGGTAWRQYFFEDGKLVFFVEQGTRPAADGAGTDSVIVVLDFDASGEVEAFYKAIGGMPADLGESEGVLVLQSLERLREGARQAGP